MSELYMGDEYAVSVSKAVAKRLYGDELKMGWEAPIAKRKKTVEGMEFSTELCLANISGSYQVHSCNTPKDQWLETFIFCPEKLVFGT